MPNGTDTLSPEFVIQAEDSTANAVSVLRAWSQKKLDATDYCVIQGPKGCGRSHMLRALEGACKPDEVVFCGGLDEDWGVGQSNVFGAKQQTILIDDFDEYSGEARQALVAAIKAGGHRATIAVRALTPELEKQWKYHLSVPRTATLRPVEERPKDIAVFCGVWARDNSVTLPKSSTFVETATYLCELGIPDGFCDVIEILRALTDDGRPIWDPVSPLLPRYHRRVVRERKSALPIILVEGKTDELYLNWASKLATGGPPRDLEIRPCHKASQIPAAALELRNRNQKYVGLFDNDEVGRACSKDMSAFGHPNHVLPIARDPLQGKAGKIVDLSIEIEDLIPSSHLERFLVERKRLAEMIVELPRAGVKRIVVHKDDKYDCAQWVQDNVDPQGGTQIREVYNILREHLGLKWV